MGYELHRVNALRIDFWQALDSFFYILDLNCERLRLAIPSKDRANRSIPFYVGFSEIYHNGTVKSMPNRGYTIEFWTLENLTFEK